VLGWGWDYLARDGAHLTDHCASLAFTLPALPSSWRVDLAFSVEGEAGPLEIDIECNGEFLSREAISRSGPVRLYVGQAQLKEIFAGGRACCLTVRLVDPSAVRKLRLDRITTVVAPLGPTLPAPRLPEGKRIALGGGAHQVGWLSCGWQWPADDGVSIAGSHGQIILSTEKADGRGMLRLGLEAENGAALQRAPAAWINGRRSKLFLAPGGRSVSIPLKLGRLFEDGVVGLDLVAPPDTFRSSAKLRLRWMRLDALDSDGPLGAILLNRSYSLSKVATHRLVEARSLILSNSAPAQIDGSGFELRFRAPCEGAVRISLGIVSLRPDLDCVPVSARLTFGDDIVDVVLGRTSTVTVQSRVEAAQAEGGLLRISLESEAPLADFGVNWFLVSEVESEAAERVSLIEGPHDADSLFRAVDDGGDWYSPTDGAFWLATQRGSLTLDCGNLEAGNILELMVLTLPGLDQRLTVSALDQSVSTSQGGREALRILLPCAVPSIRLTLTTNRLVSLEAIGGREPGRMIGGAIVGLNVIASATDEAALGTAAE
jgi:hypothetical protein